MTRVTRFIHRELGLQSRRNLSRRRRSASGDGNSPRSKPRVFNRFQSCCVPPGLREAGTCWLIEWDSPGTSSRLPSVRALLCGVIERASSPPAIGMRSDPAGKEEAGKRVLASTRPWDSLSRYRKPRCRYFIRKKIMFSAVALRCFG